MRSIIQSALQIVHDIVCTTAAPIANDSRRSKNTHQIN